MQVAMTPRGLPEPGAPPVPEKTMSRWTQFLGSIAAGVHLPDAMMKHYITRADIEAAIRSDPGERQRWDEARLAAQKIGWSAFDFEDIFQRIAAGMPVNKAVAEVKGDSGPIHATFNKIIIADSVLNEQYMAALKSRALVMQEEIIELADDNGSDVIHNDKGPAPNNAAVNRSKLQVETRLRLMGAWHTKLFGEQKNQVQVNVQVNHAERLEQARSRAVSHKATVTRIPQKLIDAAFKDVPAAEPEPLDTSWDVPAPKEPAMDMSWLE